MQQKEVKTFVDNEIAFKTKDIIKTKVTKLFEDFAVKKEQEEVKKE